MKLSLCIELDSEFLAQHIINAAVLLDGSEDKIDDVDLDDALGVVYLLCDAIVDNYSLDEKTDMALHQIRDFLRQRRT